MALMWLEHEDLPLHRLRCLRPYEQTDDIEALFDHLDERVRDAPHERWLIDLEGIMFVSSRALATLIATARRVHAAGGRMAMLNVHQFVATVLRTMRIVRLVPLFEVEDEARAYLYEGMARRDGKTS